MLALTVRAAYLMTALSISMLTFVCMFWVTLYRMPVSHGLVCESRAAKSVVLPALDDIGMVNDSFSGVEFDMQR